MCPPAVHVGFCLTVCVVARSLGGVRKDVERLVDLRHVSGVAPLPRKLGHVGMTEARQSLESGADDLRGRAGHDAEDVVQGPLRSAGIFPLQSVGDVVPAFGWLSAPGWSIDFGRCANGITLL